jgi:hypothetical protein
MAEKVRRTITPSFAAFVKEIEVFDILAELVLFRGQPVIGNLLPSIARNDRATDTTSQERRVLSQLRLMGASFAGVSHANELELLVLARHFGLKTRLLDWTSNPLAALWFACSNTSLGDVYVYALESDNLQKDGVYETDPFDAASTRVFQPRLSNPRLLAQHAWFTLHCFAKKSKQFVPLERNPKIRPQLTEIVIPDDRRKDMLKSLDRHGISSRTLFPDLEGLCRHLNWKHQLT